MLCTETFERQIFNCLSNTWNIFGQNLGHQIDSVFEKTYLKSEKKICLDSYLKNLATFQRLLLLHYINVISFVINPKNRLTLDDAHPLGII